MKECGRERRITMIEISPQNGCAKKTDEILAEESKTDERSYACLIERYEKKLARYITRIGIFTNEDVEEILQETFIKAYENIEDFDANLKFSSWIYRIAHNEAVSRIRRDASRRTLSQTEFNELVEQIADELTIEEEIDTSIVSREIRNIIAAMDPKYRDVLVLRFLEHKDYGEISDILKKPTGTIATLLNRAKKIFEKEAKRNPVISSSL